MEPSGTQSRNMHVSIVRRLGSTPQESGSTTSMSCPDVFLLSDGRIACIGTDLTEELKKTLPPGASIGADERMVALPLRAVRDAIPDIPEY